MTIEEQEGEFFVDEAVKPIPSKSQWEDLSVSELIDVQLQLEDKLWTFAKNPAIAKPLQEGLNALRALIASRAS
jgi:hypothetical protein